MKEIKTLLNYYGNGSGLAPCIFMLTFKYLFDTVFALPSPTSGVRIIGKSDVTAIGNASVIQYRAISITMYAHFASCKTKPFFLMLQSF